MFRDANDVKMRAGELAVELLNAHEVAVLTRPILLGELANLESAVLTELQRAEDAFLMGVLYQSAPEV